MSTTTAVRPTPALLAELTRRPLPVKPLSQRAKQDMCSAWKQYYRSRECAKRTLREQTEECWNERRRELQARLDRKFIANATILPVLAPKAPSSAPPPLKLAERVARLLQRQARVAANYAREALDTFDHPVTA